MQRAHEQFESYVTNVEDVELVPVGDGDLVFTRQGEWHGYRNTGDTETVML